MTDIGVREEAPADAEQVRRVVAAAFERPAEADLVDRLRGKAGVFSLVAVAGPEIVGHIMFTPVTVRGTAQRVLGLGPMAVAPAWQRRGIGGRLIRQGLDACRARGAEFVVVLGHPEYYPRFDFAPAAALGPACKWPVPAEAFMALDLRPAATGGAPAPPGSRDARLVEYLPEFDDV